MLYTCFVFAVERPSNDTDRTKIEQESHSNDTDRAQIERERSSNNNNIGLIEHEIHSHDTDRVKIEENDTTDMAEIEHEGPEIISSMVNQHYPHTYVDVLRKE